MSEIEIEPPEYPKMRYTRNGERHVDGKEFLKSKTGQDLLESVLNMKIISDAESDSRD